MSMCLKLKKQMALMWSCIFVNFTHDAPLKMSEKNSARVKGANMNPFGEDVHISLNTQIVFHHVETPSHHANV